MTASQTKGISILLVDDHPVVRQGYRRVLEHQDDFQVVAEADNAADAYRAFKAHAPDVVVMDISMPGASGLEADQEHRARSVRHAHSRLQHALRGGAGEGRFQCRGERLCHEGLRPFSADPGDPFGFARRTGDERRHRPGAGAGKPLPFGIGARSARRAGNRDLEATGGRRDHGADRLQISISASRPFRITII